MTNEKPKFEELTMMYLPSKELVFNAQKAGPMDFNGLINVNHQEGFRMSTIPEIVPLVYASLENKDRDTR